MKNNKTQKTVLISLSIIIFALIMIWMGNFAYSFMGPDVSDNVTSDGEVTATGDTLIFSKGNALSLTATTDNFNSQSGNLSSTTNPSVRLVASSRTNNATATYATGFVIKENTYQYSTVEKTSEVILTVKDENMNIIDSAANLNYVTYHEGQEDEVSGFDITGLQGAFTVAKDHPISTTSSTDGEIHTWTYTLTFINFETDQSINENSTLEIDVLMQKNEIVSLANYIKSTAETDSTLILHNGTITDPTYDVIDAEDNNYRYSGSSEEVKNFVCFGSDAATCPNDNLYRIVGVFGDQVKLIKYDYALTNLLGTDGEYKGGYQDSGYDVSYYKGQTDVSTIPAYYFNTVDGESSIHDWTTSKLNTVNLNTNYVKNIGSKWMEKIADTTWKIGGMTWAQGSASPNIAKNAYKYELGANSIDRTHQAKIGLLYMSDYYYAASSTYWTYYGYNTDETKDYRAAKENNWMYMGLDDWSISPRIEVSNQGFYVFHIWYGNSNYVYTHGFGVRPTFYLKASTLFSRGSGVMADPYRIS